jgi:ApaG protein
VLWSSVLGSSALGSSALWERDRGVAAGLAFLAASPIFPRDMPMTRTPHSDTTTDGIRVHAAAELVPPDSLPPEFQASAGRQFVFRYRITMHNVGTVTARLYSRHWVIVDGNGQREEVRGRGVVGKYPLLAPGESYTYSSFCPIDTNWGTMEGSYSFEREGGGRFTVKIGRFFLVPGAPALPVESPSS